GGVTTGQVQSSRGNCHGRALSATSHFSASFGALDDDVWSSVKKTVAIKQPREENPLLNLWLNFAV
ncbi:Hypothetical predicted protein, partial [Cloeon dipterum]